MVKSWVMLAAILVIILKSSVASADQFDPIPQQQLPEITPGLQERRIALTFDDGPTPDETSEILDILRDYNAHATFFVLGSRVEQYPEIARREVAEGHEIANHTYSHLLCEPGVSLTKLINDIRKAQEVIHDTTGVRPKLFRPPHGLYNEQLIQAIQAESLQLALWTDEMDTMDWDRPGVAYIVKRVLKNASDGDIVLFHDHVHGKSNTMDALRKILPELKNRGYQFVTMSELEASSVAQ